MAYVIEVNDAATCDSFRIENSGENMPTAKLKELIKEKLGIEPEDQRLVFYKGEPILKEQTSIALKAEEPTVILLFCRLGEESHIIVNTGCERIHLPISRATTLGDVRQIFGDVRFFHRWVELKDDSRSLDHYEIYAGATLKIHHEHDPYLMKAFSGDGGANLTFMIGPYTTVRFLKERLARWRTTADKLTLYSGKVEMIDDFLAITYCKAPAESLVVRCEGLPLAYVRPPWTSSS